jgi:hypothetical protein
MNYHMNLLQRAKEDPNSLCHECTLIMKKVKECSMSLKTIATKKNKLGIGESKIYVKSCNKFQNPAPYLEEEKQYTPDCTKNT